MGGESVNFATRCADQDGLRFCGSPVRLVEATSDQRREIEQIEASRVVFLPGAMTGLILTGSKQSDRPTRTGEGWSLQVIHPGARMMPDADGANGGTDSNPSVGPMELIESGPADAVLPSGPLQVVLI